MIPEIYQKNKFYYLALLIYSLGLPTLVVILNFGFGHILNFEIMAIIEIALLFILLVFILLIFSIIKDDNKLPSIIISLFILIYFPIYIIRFFDVLGDPSRLIKVASVFARPIAYIPVAYFIFSTLWKVYLSGRNAINTETNNNKLPRVVKKILIISIVLVFMGPPFLIFGPFSLISYLEIMLLLNSFVVCTNLILAIISFAKYKKSLAIIFINLLLGVVILGMFAILGIAAVNG